MIIFSLNRTMQYGNKIEESGYVPYCFSLNRTMQYGNTLTTNINLSRKKFKSYYVVWKPIGHYHQKKFEVTFKSYYVVWKLDQQKGFFYDVWSLNRTMQYGNPFEPYFLRTEFQV